jgi:hypothetical protein
MRRAFLLAALMLPLLPAPALAGIVGQQLFGSISPSSFEAFGPSGFSVTVSKTVEIFTEANGFPDTLAANGYLEYSNVTLDLTDVPAGLLATCQATDLGGSNCTYPATFNTSDNAFFSFDVTFTDIADGTYEFNIYALAVVTGVGTTRVSAIGGGFAMEADRIVITPEPATLLLLGSGLAGLGTLAWRRRR